VWFCEWCTLTARALAFIIQSGEHSAAYLEGRAAAFADGMAAQLAAQAPDEFASQACAADALPQRSPAAPRSWV
jgi:secreted Zn-dependent insulinase-like peptidase